MASLCAVEATGGGPFDRRGGLSKRQHEQEDTEAACAALDGEWLCDEPQDEPGPFWPGFEGFCALPLHLLASGAWGCGLTPRLGARLGANKNPKNKF
jgi:hypothetical protein